jgi:hypothetical protein
MTSSITRLVLAIKSLESDETLERWQFDIQTDEAAIAALPGTSGAKSQVPPTKTGATGSGKKKEKTEKEVQGEIREIMKQITSSVTFLPILEDPCESFRPAGAEGQARSPCSLTQIRTPRRPCPIRGAMPIRTSSTGAKSSRSGYAVSARTCIRSR